MATELKKPAKTILEKPTQKIGHETKKGESPIKFQEIATAGKSPRNVCIEGKGRRDQTQPNATTQRTKKRKKEGRCPHQGKGTRTRAKKRISRLHTSSTSGRSSREKKDERIHPTNTSQHIGVKKNLRFTKTNPSNTIMPLKTRVFLKGRHQASDKHTYT